MAKAATTSKKAVAKAGTTPKTKKATPAVPGLAPAGTLARPTTRCKFTLFNLLGQPRAYYLVEPMDLPPGLTKDEVTAKIVPTGSPSRAKGTAGIVGLFVKPN